ncbi:PREDICTED: T-cell surface glycoprotein CD8 alpha chain [Nanorana parkeri]|uniref:T-cell surface glycoprotein CD8 alpha chain n=1 Tax=Nanorana parkeri TaxID=125878 RepID=UPI000854BA0D|nr:PREDICTED: T-cell surface glycoprotein CD8 alpha chain [Nanorana parkeri]
MEDTASPSALCVHADYTKLSEKRREGWRYSLTDCSQHLKLQGPMVQRGSAQLVKLDCIGEHGDSMEHGIFWFRQKKNEKNPEGIVYLSMVNKELYRDQKQNSHFKADKSGSSYTLTIKSFQNEDQGTYYCMINKNSVLTFSPGHQLFYPEVTTPKPTTTKPPATSGTGSKSGDDCSCNSGKTGNTKAESWKIDCDIHIWAPLVGLCGFLLICLLTTAIMLCFRTRRRRCRCKHRPLEERNGQMNLMNKHKK